MWLRGTVLILSFFVFFSELGMGQVTPPWRTGKPPGSTGMVTGTVHTSKNQAVSGAVARLLDHNGLAIATVLTDERGNFEIDLIPEGWYDLTVISGSTEERRTVNVSGAATTVVITLPASAENRAAESTSTVSVAALQVPEKARQAYDQAVKHYRARRLAEVEKSLDKALAIYPRYAAAMTLRGLLRLNARRLGEAEQQFQAAVKNDPNEHMAHIGLSAAYNAEERFDEAIASAEQGLALSPTFWWGYYEMAWAMVGKKQYDSALTILNRAERVLPSEISLLRLPKAGALAGLKNYEQASLELGRYLEKEPNGPGAGNARNMLAKVKTLMAEQKN